MCVHKDFGQNFYDSLLKSIVLRPPGRSRCRKNSNGYLNARGRRGDGRVEGEGGRGGGEGGQQTFAECQGRGKRKERGKKITFTILCLKLCKGWVILRRKGQYNKVLDVKQLYELACVCVFCYKLLLRTVYFVFLGKGFFQALSSL